ncbi:MAG: ATP-grasp domain-containing protein [Chitinophagales bacterium]
MRSPSAVYRPPSVVLFCDNGFSPVEVDETYRNEYKTSKEIGFNVSLISFEALKEGNLHIALKRIKPSIELKQAIYRGWMLKPFEYKALYEALLQRNIQLINTPDQYQFCHYLPNSYTSIEAFTPKTIFKKLNGEFDIADFNAELEVFGHSSIIVKDYVKSQKHYWTEACFIPDASDRKQVKKVVKRFLELQGDDLNEGLVFREFVELEQLTTHSKSGMPLTKEFRLFIKDGEIIAQFNYWDEGDYENVQPDLTRFKELIPTIQSRFFTMDIAKKVGGDWIIVELGDGQVAGLPDNADIVSFYNTL